jgi:hypothetical protein
LKGSRDFRLRTGATGEEGGALKCLHRFKAYFIFDLYGSNLQARAIEWEDY